MGHDINYVLPKAIELLIKKLDPFVIYMFGTAASGELRSDSDIDLAYFSDLHVDQYILYLITQELSDIMKRDVDLIDLKKASTVFKVQITGKGRVIFCKDDIRRMNMEMRIFKDYSLLNEEREEILKNVQERGSIYN